MVAANKTEEILRDFFTQSYADIKDVYYIREELPDGKIKYRLYLDKMIAGQIRRISFAKESAGTQRVLEIFRIIIGSFFGATIFYDEIDNGIHDLLLTNIINSAIKNITGQLIITTHNTHLLETANVHDLYVITVDYEGNKEAVCLDEFSIQNTDNPRLKYMRGLFGGIPYSQDIEYDTIIDCISSSDEEITDVKNNGVTE